MRAVATAVLVFCCWLATRSVPDIWWPAFLVKVIPPLFIALGLVLTTGWAHRQQDKKGTALGLVVLLCWMMVSYHRPGEAGPYRVVTWNMAGGQATVPEVLKDSDAVFLQQAAGAESLAQQLGMQSEAIADLATLTRKPGVSHTISLGPENQALVVETDGVTLVNVHLSVTSTGSLFRGPSYLTERARLRELECRDLLTYLDTVEGPVVLGGDFNVPPSSQVHRRLRAQLQDGGPGWTWPAGFPLLQVDFIYLKGLTPGRVQLGAGHGSDHRTLSVQIKLPDHSDRAAR